MKYITFSEYFLQTEITSWRMNELLGTGTLWFVYRKFYGLHVFSWGPSFQLSWNPNHVITAEFYALPLYGISLLVLRGKNVSTSIEPWCTFVFPEQSSYRVILAFFTYRHSQASWQTVVLHPSDIIRVYWRKSYHELYDSSWKMQRPGVQ